MNDVIDQKLLDTVQKGARFGAIASLGGTVLMLLAFVYFTIQVDNLVVKKDALTKSLLSLTNSTQSLSDSTTVLANQSRQSGVLVNSARLKLAAGDASSAAAVLSAAPVAAAQANTKRVYFELRGKGQLPAFSACKEVLVRDGYDVPQLEQVSVGPNQASVRYFHADEKPAADQLVAALGTCAGMNFTTKLIGGDGAATVPNNQFEVWFSATPAAEGAANG